ncbi:MAG: Gfo/Idh/MocA family oxidoreductase [Anaerolineaceae bacterium]|nr:Gfo/Idh/MocA family oxidoreductase [Anaerolineaceae bacterium]
MIKTAVIGVGSMGQHHARVYSQLENSQLVGVADTDLNIARKIGDSFDVPAYDNYLEMLEVEKPEAVTVAVPTNKHEMVVSDVLDAGAHVLVEKPIAATLEEGQRLIDKAKFHNLQLMVGHIVRFNPATQLLKKKLLAGDLGRIYQIVSRRVGPFPARIRDVGVIIDLAPHDLDLMRYLTDKEPVRVFAETEQRIHTDHEDLLTGMLRFPDGIVGILEINWLTPTKIRETIVLGERGMFRVDDLTQDLYYFENAQASEELWRDLRVIKGVSEGEMIRYAVDRQEPLKAELIAFLDALESGEKVPVSGEDGLAALRLALALVQSGQEHQIIKV